jgi:hypothetical protein
MYFYLSIPHIYKAFTLYNFNLVKEEGLPLLKGVEFHIFMFFVEPDDGRNWPTPLDQWFKI